MNILIVDDYELNRIFLKELLKRFQKTVEQSIKISEANDGKMAVAACKNSFYDLVLMDIFMPNMDGVLATKIIHQESPKTMIIAVSGIDDDALKYDILKNGAEDYISKPVNPEIFLKRMIHYADIINARSTLAPKRTGIDVINLFDNNVYSRRISFLIFNQISLSDFWDYLMQSQHNSSFVDVVRLLYGIGIWQLKLGYKFYIFLEEGTDFWYFTITNANLLDSKTLLQIIEKNYPNGIFNIAKDRVSFCISKTPMSLAISKSSDDGVQPLNTSIQKETKLQVFNFIDNEDLKEVLEINDKLRSLLLPVEISSLELEEVDQIADYLQKFGNILCVYSEIYAVASAIKSLGIALQDNAQAFQKRSSNMAKLCQAFNYDLEIWLKTLFIQGASSIDFMDSSLISDIDMIINILQQDNEKEIDFDAIFDF
jgi:CheY-like chemotaxis protein